MRREGREKVQMEMRREGEEGSRGYLSRSIRYVINIFTNWEESIITFAAAFGFRE